jgi:ABC-type transport system involved in cytochrome bd biosynthesis fused ATPase/permease subunit
VAVAPHIAPSVLHDITLYIPRGKLTIVCGAVGAGKSSLLAGLLGEMKKKAGTVKIAGSMAYCSQQAWISNSSVRHNVLFGRPFEQARYDETIRACALTRDLRVLPDGDQTEVGEKGLTLSGGQKVSETNNTAASTR